VPGLPRFAAGVDGDLVGVFRNGGDGALQADLTALSANHLGHGFADFAVIDNAGRIEKQAAQTDDVGFALAQLVGVQAFDLQLIQLRARIKCLHALHFQGRGGHQQLAAHLELDPVFAAKPFGGLGAAFAQIGLEAAGGVVDAGVNHPAVMPGLVLGQRGFFFQDHQ